MPGGTPVPEHGWLSTKMAERKEQIAQLQRMVEHQFAAR